MAAKTLVAFAMVGAILAQATTDPLSASEWAKTGLLGGVLGWLLFWYLPSKDKQNQDALASRDALVAKLLADFKEEAREQRKECTANFEMITRSIDALTHKGQS